MLRWTVFDESGRNDLRKWAMDFSADNVIKVHIKLLTTFLGESVHIRVILAGIHLLIVCNIIDIVLVQERLVDYPRCVRHHFIRPSTMTDRFASLGMSHSRGGFMRSAKLVRANTDN